MVRDYAGARLAEGIYQAHPSKSPRRQTPYLSKLASQVRKLRKEQNRSLAHRKAFRRWMRTNGATYTGSLPFCTGNLRRGIARWVHEGGRYE